MCVYTWHPLMGPSAFRVNCRQALPMRQRIIVRGLKISLLWSLGTTPAGSCRQPGLVELLVVRGSYQC